MYKQVQIDMLNPNETRFMKYLFQGAIKYRNTKYLDKFDRDKLVPEVYKVTATIADDIFNDLTDSNDMYDLQNEIYSQVRQAVLTCVIDNSNYLKVEIIGESWEYNNFPNLTVPEGFIVPITFRDFIELTSYIDVERMA